MAGKKKYAPFGVDLDPDNTLGETVLPDGDIQGFYKGKPENYDNVIDELEERATRNQQGKPPEKNKNYFSGFNFKR